MPRYPLKIMLPIVLLFCTAVPAFAAEQGFFTHLLSIYADEKEGSIKNPEGVVCNGAGSAIFVADTGNGRLLKYAFKDGALSGGTEVKLPQLVYPVRLQLNSRGDILALDERQRRIVRLSGDGAFIDFVDAKGLPAPSDVVPRSFKLGGQDNIYVLDISGWRVLFLDPAGNYQKQAALPEKGFFSDLYVDPRGVVYLLDSVNKIVYVYDKDSNSFKPLTTDLGDYANFPTYMTSDGKGTLYIVDQDGNGIILLGQDGTFKGRRLGIGWSDGLVYYPAQICIDEKGDVFVADRYNNRVQIFSIPR